MRRVFTCLTSGRQRALSSMAKAFFRRPGLSHSQAKQTNKQTTNNMSPLPRISHGTARPDCCCVSAAPHLHCVSWPHPNTGRSPVRPIAVVVYLIRPNRGLTAVLLGKSTTTNNKQHQQVSVSRGSRETFFLFFSFHLFYYFIN